MDAATTDPPGQHGHDPEPTRQQIRGSALFVAGRGISLGINLAVQLLAVAYLSKLEYGAFAYALSVVDLLSRFAVFGMDKAAARFAAMYHARHDHARVFGSLVLMLGIVVALGLGAVVTTIGLRGFLGSRVVSRRLSLQLLTTLIVLVPVEALNLLLHSVFAAFAEARFIF